MITKLYKENKETTHNFLWRALQLFSKQGFTALVFFIAASMLTPEKFGILGYLSATAALLIVISDFGIATAITKIVAEYDYKNPKKVNKIFITAATFITIFNVLITIFILVFGKSLFKDEFYYILLFLPYLFFLPLASVLDGIYRGLNQFKKLAIISMVVGIFQLLSAYVLLKYYGVEGMIISQDIYSFLLLFILLLSSKRITFSFDKKLLKKILKYSVIIGISSCMFYLYTQADILILKHYGYITEIGYYNLVTKIFGLIVLPFVIFGQVLATKNTQRYIRKEYGVLLKDLKKQIFVLMLLGILMSAALFFIFPLVLRLGLPQYYVWATILMFNLLLLILPFKIISAVVNHAHTVPTGNAHFSMWTMVPAGILNVVLDFYFIAKFGFIGAVYATLISNFFGAVSFIIPYYYKLKRLSRGRRKA